jgi:S1-C subfamily serine protease
MSAIATRAAFAVPRRAGLQGLGVSVRTAARRTLVVVLLAAALAGAGAAATAAGEQTLLRAATADRASIVLVVACVPGDASSCRSSTAFAVAPGLYVTAFHALLGADVVTLSSASHGTAVGEVVRADDASDLVVLRSSLRLPALRTAAAVTAGEGAAVVCSRRAITSDGLAGRPATYTGQVGGAPIRVADGGRHLLLERVAGAASVLGCSGSPVVDRDGAVTGVLLAGDGQSAGMVDARDLAALIGR